MKISELDTEPGQFIKLRGPYFAAKGTQVGPSHIVSHNQKDIGLFGGSGRRGVKNRQYSGYNQQTKTVPRYLSHFGPSDPTLLYRYHYRQTIRLTYVI
jgi:hypothetical protein